MVYTFSELSPLEGVVKILDPVYTHTYVYAQTGETLEISDIVESNKYPIGWFKLSLDSQESFTL